jgi:hypothetical protein
MKLARLAAIVASTGLLATGCTTEPVEHLAGCFSLDADKAATLKVVQNDDEKYSISMLSEGKWSEAAPMRLGDADLAQSILGEDGSKVKASLVSDNGPIVLFKVEPEDKFGGSTADSGFIGSFYFGTGQIFKAEECEDA